jgi:hypothetical protein
MWPYFALFFASFGTQCRLCIGGKFRIAPKNHDSCALIERLQARMHDNTALEPPGRAAQDQIR